MKGDTSFKERPSTPALTIKNRGTSLSELFDKKFVCVSPYQITVCHHNEVVFWFLISYRYKGSLPIAVLWTEVLRYEHCLANLL